MENEHNTKKKIVIERKSEDIGSDTEIESGTRTDDSVLGNDTSISSASGTRESDLVDSTTSYEDKTEKTVDDFRPDEYKDIIETGESESDSYESYDETENDDGNYIPDR
eukprot:UN00851